MNEEVFFLGGWAVAALIVVCYAVHFYLTAEPDAEAPGFNAVAIGVLGSFCAFFWYLAVGAALIFAVAYPVGRALVALRRRRHPALQLPTTDLREGEVA